MKEKKGLGGQKIFKLDQGLLEGGDAGINFERQEGIRWTKSNEVEGTEYIKEWQHEIT